MTYRSVLIAAASAAALVAPAATGFAQVVADPDATVRSALVHALREFPLAASMVDAHWPDVASRSA